MAERLPQWKLDPVRTSLLGGTAGVLGIEVAKYGWGALLHISTWVVALGTMLLLALVWMIAVGLITSGRPKNTNDPTA